jgi:hypothetical protein
MGPQTLGRRQGQLSHADGRGEFLELTGVQTPQAEPDAPLPAHQPQQALGQPVQLLLPDGNQGEHSVGLQAPQGEDQRLERGEIRPVGVVQDDGHRAGVLGQPQKVDQHRPHGQRVAGATGVGRLRGNTTGQRFPTRPQQLLGHAEGKAGLHLLPRGRDPVQVLGAGQEAAQEGGLADPGQALDEHHPRAAPAHLVHRGLEDRQLALPADEGLVHGRAPLRHPR